MESVKQHRRRLPDDGPRFLVKVRHYWRHMSIRELHARSMAFLLHPKKKKKRARAA